MPTDERVERVARELHAMDYEVSDTSKPWEDAHQDAYREMAERVLRVADALTPEPKPIGYIVIATSRDRRSRGSARSRRAT